MEAKIRRRQALQDTRQSMVLAAAKRVIAREGLDGASIRQIALEAGYTPGALYAFFEGKHALLLALLEEALGQLTQELSQVKVPKGQLAQGWLLKAEAWIRWLVLHPQEVQLLLYCVGGGGRQAPSMEAVAQARRALYATLQAVADGLSAQGLPPDKVAYELEALMAHGLGLLVAQTVPLKSLPATPDGLPPVSPEATPLDGKSLDGKAQSTPDNRPASAYFADYLRRLQLVYSMSGELTGLPELPVGSSGPSPQPDLFG